MTAIRLAAPARFYPADQSEPIEHYEELVRADVEWAAVSADTVTLSVSTGDPEASFGFEVDLSPAEAARLGERLISVAHAGLRAASGAELARRALS